MESLPFHPSLAIAFLHSIISALLRIAPAMYSFFVRRAGKHADITFHQLNIIKEEILLFLLVWGLPLQTKSHSLLSIDVAKEGMQTLGGSNLSSLLCFTLCSWKYWACNGHFSTTALSLMFTCCDAYRDVWSSCSSGYTVKLSMQYNVSYDNIFPIGLHTTLLIQVISMVS